MADVTLIKTKNRVYLRSNSDKGRDYMINEFNGCMISVEMVNVGFNIEQYDAIEKHLKECDIEIDYK
jgi:hypothetical protein